MKKTLFALLVCMAPICALAQLPSYLPTDGLVGWWPFNGNANDESGNGNHGMVIGASLESDRFSVINSSYSFLNPNSKISVPSISSDSISSISISGWFKKSLAGIDAAIFAMSNGCDGADGLRLFIGNDNFLYWQVEITSCIGFGVFSNFINYADNNWHFFVATYNKTNPTYVTTDFSLWIDGINVGISNSNSTQGINSPITNNLFSTTIGNNNLSNNQFTGYLDDIAIYNRALTQEEITALYTATPTNGGGGNNTASANVPQGISYQAVARNPQGQPLTNTALQVKFTLLSDSLTGTAEYAELHSLTTNDLGLFTTAFGTGTPLSGTFANINWAGGNKFVKIEADQGSGFIEMGTQQMLSVPYSMRSQTSAAIQNNALPVYANNAAALAGGLQAGQMYRTAAGDLKIVY
jgi:hypothetical protein